jgi:hypothetical protein
LFELFADYWTDSLVVEVAEGAEVAEWQEESEVATAQLL